MKTVVVPKLGDTVEEGKILRWVKHEGDQVKRGETLVELETAKVNVELEACASGVVRRLLAKEGETVQIGTVIALLEDADEPLSTADVSLGQYGAPTLQPPWEGNRVGEKQNIAFLQRGILVVCLLAQLTALGVCLLNELWLVSILIAGTIVLLTWLASRRYLAKG